MSPSRLASIDHKHLKENMHYDPTKNIVFKENHLGEWVNKEGYTILEKPSDIEDWKDYLLISPSGEQVSGPFSIKSLLIHEDRYVKLISLLASKGRGVKDPVKFNTGHFTKGTVVKYNTSPHTNAPDKIATVRKVFSNGPGSYAIEVEEKHPSDHFLSGENIGFNIEWVTGIIHRPAGKAKVEYERRDFIPYKGTYNCISFKSFIMEFRNSVEHANKDGCFINEEKLFKRLKQMGLIKYNTGTVGTRSFSYINVKRKEALKFLKKNSHWGYYTVKQSREIEEEYNEKLMADSF